MIYPWQETIWNQLAEIRIAQRLPHALLLTGQVGLGQDDFARELAQVVLCEKKQSLPCNECRSCHLFTLGNHPDFYPVNLLPESHTIKIDQIRELVQDLGQTAQLGEHQVVMISPAEAMNVAAFNALLKTLEEPIGNVLFLLVTYQQGALPATITSRCQRVVFQIQHPDQALTWLRKQLPNDSASLLLKIAENSPLRALSLAEQNGVMRRDEVLQHLLNVHTTKSDPIRCASEWAKSDISLIFSILLTIALDLIKVKLSINASHLVNEDQLEKITQLSQFFNLSQLLVLLTELQQAQKVLRYSTGANTQLLVEHVLLALK